jgi:predicted TIM-barrel fold metal-dependent hydrolase
MLDIPRIISVDDHVLEPPDLWSSRLPARFLERGPRIIRKKLRREGTDVVEAEDGRWGDVWYYDDLVSPLLMLSAAVGFDHLSFGFTTFDEVRPGAWKQVERLEDMDADHIDVSICFPNTLPRFCGQTFLEREDKQLALLCVEAYNDWMIDEWTSGPARGRLIPLGMVPLWDPILAAAEVRRNADRGCFAVTFTENPEPLGLPTLYRQDRFWDPFFAACEETGTTVCMHIGSSSRMPTTTSDAPFIIGSSLDWLNAMGSMLDYVFSGTLQRFPLLKLAYSEGQVGWMPYILERADKKWEEFHGEEFGNTLREPPSSYLKGRVFGCVFDDDTGLRNRDVIGMDRICYETDYPHAQATFPKTKEIATRMCERAGLDEGEVYALMRGNAIRAFGLERFGITS